jgi:hypothetical protein
MVYRFLFDFFRSCVVAQVEMPGARFMLRQ